MRLIITIIGLGCLLYVIAAMLTGCAAPGTRWDNSLVENPTNMLQQTQDGVNYLLQGTGAHY